ncbi:hypothetical protein PTTG_28702 [Puccinia triticina 1-1 BBBD Race 1]|uniref:Uncharacterized protein n=2 Tax=Puccinia triticina TaxID=208348 RepID=A0A180G9R3_PUCT1|nr:uncharacterized protein PtA15_5A541 [Puccinia triticina]OAV89364.1 hypothetical protein PTTG_28702 [Puccinia triticina 1-1 BBBD Race 1]WAQ84968.1 hypothetical protein PtA15_5A541 [Puccinia triticina]WAR58302.1 hypothetical protein PtB15_5B536 [Puccinia triticina]
MKSEMYNLIPPKAPPNLTNPNLYAGRSTKPIPLELSLPLRWQRGAQFLGVSLSITCGIWGVLFADFGNGDREIVFSPIRRWFAPYKSLIFGDSTNHHLTHAQADNVLSNTEPKPA